MEKSFPDDCKIYPCSRCGETPEVQILGVDVGMGPDVSIFYQTDASGCALSFLVTDRDFPAASALWDEMQQEMRANDSRV